MKRWPQQVYCSAEVPRRLTSGERKILVTCPTGGGKTVMIRDLIEWALDNGYLVVVYTNRRLLVRQLVRVMKKHGIECGVRMDGYQDRRELPVQISSLLTEASRVFKQERWQIHGHGRKVLAIVDEAHLNKSNVAEQALSLHLDHGGAYVGFTATPIGLAHLYESLVIAGTPSQLRASGCLVPAYHVGVDEPDMREFRQSVKTGEYTEDDVKKAIMTKCVFGRVIEHYNHLNPKRLPTILFAPGVPESRWFAEEFTKAGFPAAHIDSEGVWVDGEYEPGGDREAILERVATGELILCNRFIAREGLDLPAVAHIILATVMGSLQTYLQSCGRGARAYPGKTKFTIQDHGGHWHRHGSVNEDRDWCLDWTEQSISTARIEKFRSKETSEPICCPNCHLIRASGADCPRCGNRSNRKVRMVVQQDGRLVPHEGDVYKPRKTRTTPETEKLWASQYYRAKKSRNRMNFNQAEALFFRENGYYPPRTLPLMPTSPTDWCLPVADVPFPRLIRAERKPEPQESGLFQ